MSKYTEAETKIKKIMCEEIDRLPSHFDGEDEAYDSTKDVDEILKLNKTICKALQIADRLDQADVEEAKNIYCQELSCAGLCDECDHLEDFADGYIQALTDIRGDNE